mmetsp:Transcript_106789/g.244571  ORF Transcript_106789/g.244571 Transcript_106789/m.244571 type:complete len:131 (-) Transcript_106789:205-597(-)
MPQQADGTMPPRASRSQVDFDTAGAEPRQRAGERRRTDMNAGRPGQDPLRRTVSQGDPQPQHKCSTCGKLFRSTIGLKNHEEFEHNPIASAVSSAKQTISSKITGGDGKRETTRNAAPKAQARPVFFWCC